jgi:hypothetical protein
MTPKEQAQALQLLAAWVAGFKDAAAGRQPSPPVVAMLVRETRELLALAVPPAPTTVGRR